MKPSPRSALPRVAGAVLREMMDLVERARVETSGIASLAAKDASVDASLLDGFLDAVLSSARRGGDLGREGLDACHATGEVAADRGISLSALLDLHLSAVWRLWGDITRGARGASAGALAAAADVMFRAAADAVAAISKGYEEAQRRAIRREEALRREFIDDLLMGLAAPDALEEQAARFGFNLAGAHLVVVARTHRPLADVGPVHARVETHVLASFGGRDVVVATKEGLLVCVFPASAEDPARELPRILADTGEGPWRIGLGRPYAGPGGVIRSYDEAREALDLAARLGFDRPVARFESLLPYRLFAKDRSAVSEVVEAVLGPLRGTRGGAEPLVETLEAFLVESGNVLATARRLHLSPRAITYRLARIAKLTGYSPLDPEQRFILELAVRGRRLVLPPQ